MIYTSSIPSVYLPKHSLFDHVLPAPHLDLLPPHIPAFTDGITGRVITRATLRRDALTLAAGMVDRLHLRRGQVIMILSPNSIEYPLTLLAAVAAGLRVTFANPTYLPQEIEHQYRDSGASYIFVHPSILAIALKALLQLGFSHAEARSRIILMSPRDQIPKTTLFQGILDLESLSAQRQLTHELFYGDSAVQETVLLYYSSGTTGKAKGVETTHHNITSVLEMSRYNWTAVESERDVMLAVIPWYHITGGAVTMLFTLMMGVNTVVLPRFEPASFLSAIQNYKVTTMVIAPPILIFFAKSPLLEKYNISSLTTILSGSAPASASLIQSASDRLAEGGASVTIGQAYGLTETSPGTHTLPPEFCATKVGSVGRLMPNLEARLVDADDVDVPVGSAGELWIRGPSVMKGYLNNPEATKDAITPDGWFKTGDIAVIDEDGFCSIVDRKKELIKYKGFQVPPAELEALLMTHEGIADAGVIGVFSEAQHTELPRAYIVPRATGLTSSARAMLSVDVQAWVKARAVHYKQLRGGVIVVDSIPRSAAGKILRKDLRALASKDVEPATIRASL